MAHTDLQSIGRDVFERSLSSHPPKWTSTTIAEQYSLNEAQVRIVKRAAKREGAKRGVPWAWHPQSGYFRCAPANSPTITREMIEFGYDCWANAGHSISDVLRGGIGIGHVINETGHKAIGLNDEIEAQVRDIVTGIEYAA